MHRYLIQQFVLHSLSHVSDMTMLVIDLIISSWVVTEVMLLKSHVELFYGPAEPGVHISLGSNIRLTVSRVFDSLSSIFQTNEMLVLPTKPLINHQHF